MTKRPEKDLDLFWKEIHKAAAQQRREMAALKPAHVTRLEIADMKIDELQARLGAIAAIIERSNNLSMSAAQFLHEERGRIEVLARGTPARECARLMRRLAKKEKSGG